MADTQPYDPPRAARAAPVATVTVHCKIYDDNKEEPGSYHVVVRKFGDPIFEVSRWGLRENWDNGSEHEISSGNLTKYGVPAKGEFILDVELDSGTNIDVDHRWWIFVEDIEGTVHESSHGPREHWVSGVKRNTYRLMVS